VFYFLLKVRFFLDKGCSATFYARTRAHFVRATWLRCCTQSWSHRESVIICVVTNCYLGKSL